MPAKDFPSILHYPAIRDRRPSINNTVQDGRSNAIQLACYVPHTHMDKSSFFVRLFFVTLKYRWLGILGNAEWTCHVDIRVTWDSRLVATVAMMTPSKNKKGKIHELSPVILLIGSFSIGGCVYVFLSISIVLTVHKNPLVTLVCSPSLFLIVRETPTTNKIEKK